MPKRINQIITELDENTHMKTKNALAGSHNLVVCGNYIIIDSTAGLDILPTKKMVPSIAKCIDEAVTNAIDHFINCLTKKTINHEFDETAGNRLMTNLDITIDRQTCAISIKNNGYGIPVVELKPGLMTARAIYLQNRTGSNFGDDQHRITGGTNGMGAKIIVANSTKFKYIGQDADKRYEFVADVDKNGASSVTREQISDKQGQEQFTYIQFLLDWSGTGYKNCKNLYSEIFQLLFRRAILAHWYMNNYSPCTVTLNNRQLDFGINKIIELSKLTEVTKIRITSPDHPDERFRVFTLIIGINDYARRKYIQMSLINSVEVGDNPIIEYVLKNIFGRIREKLVKNTKSRITFESFKKCITAVFIGAICGPEWGSQIKDKILVPPGYLSSLKYDIGDVDTRFAQKLTKYFILDQVKNPSKSLTTAMNTGVHIPADDLRRNKKTTKYVIITEGDSAETLIKRILSQHGCKLNMDNTGRMKLKGVPVNVYNRMKIQILDEFSDITPGATGKSIILMDEKCQKNNEINVLLKNVMGLSINTPVSEVLDRMNYQHYIIASDQDLDGWNINGILLTFFDKFPELFEQRRIWRLQTPIARIRPKVLTKENIGSSIEFFTIDHLETWLKSNKVPSGMTIKYYKGLGTNEDLYAGQIAKNIDSYLYSFWPNPKYRETLARYYDKENPDLRKQELSTPVRDMRDVEKTHLSQRSFPITTFLEIYVKQYQLYNLGRKLLSVMGGQNRVTNKIIYGIDCISPNGEIKVALAGNRIINHTNYPHGEASMYEAIFNQGQMFPGSTNLYNIINGVGEFGTKLAGGKDHASARYVSITYDRKFKNAIYRPEDQCILPYQYEENEQIDPIFQLPVVPIILFRNYKTTAHGWQIQIWARDVRRTIGTLITMINGGEVGGELPMHRTKSRFVTIDGKTYSRAIFKVEGNTIYIRELPFGVWAIAHCDQITKKATDNPIMKEILKDYIDKSEVDGEYLNIRIELNPGWQNKIPKQENPVFSDVELFFRLRIRIRDELNLISVDGSVIEFRSYMDILRYWFEHRKRYYLLRIERQIEIVKNKILVQSNICQYLQHFEEWKLSDPKITKSEAKQILEKNGLVKINTELIEPNYKIELRYVRKFLLVSSARTEITADELVDFDSLRELKIISKYATYEYLNSIRTDQIRTEKLASKMQALADLQSELELLQKQDRWRELWLAEIENLRPHMLGQ